MSNEIVTSDKKNWMMVPESLDEAMKFAELIAKSDLVPKDFKDKPSNVIIGMQMGAEVGLSPMQSLQSIAVINGRPSLWGDGQLAICQVHPDFEWIKEEFDDKGTAVCTVKRKGYPEHVQSFSTQDVAVGGYDRKAGPWQTSRTRMMQLRARGFALRDRFADALKGLASAEESIDIAEANAVTVDTNPAPMKNADIIKDKLKSKKEAPAITEQKSADKEELRPVIKEEQIIEAVVVQEEPVSKKPIDVAFDEPTTPVVVDRQINREEWTACIDMCGKYKIDPKTILEQHGCSKPSGLTIVQLNKIMADMVK